MDNDNKKIDLRLIRQLISDLEVSVATLETLDVDSLSKEDGTIQKFTSEAAKAYGTVSAVVLEAGALGVELMGLIKVYGLKTELAPGAQKKMMATSGGDLLKSLEELIGPPKADKPKPGGSLN